MKRIFGGSAMFAMVMATACGGGGSLTLSQFLSKSVDAQCHIEFRCCSTAEIGELFMGEQVNNQPVTTEQQCDQFEGGLVLLAAGIAQESVDKGRLAFDGGAAQDCVDAIQGASCSDLSGGGVSSVGSTACAGVLTPKVAVGGACSQDLECTTNNCVGAQVGSDGQQQDGACQDLPATGSACDFNCVAGDFCGFDGSAETCEPKAGAGSACEDNEECQTGTCEGSDGAKTCVAICQGGS